MMVEFEVRKAKEGEDLSSLPSFDYTKLSAMDTCNRWGVIRYGHHLATSSGGRSMALEAGHACHEVFAAVRLFDLLEYGPSVYRDTVIGGLVRTSAIRMYGGERADEYLRRCTAVGEDETSRAMSGAQYILDTSGYYDDPDDKRRTLQRISESIAVFVDRYPFGKHVPYVSDDQTFVGVETPFEFAVEYTTDIHHRLCRFYGRIDGVSCYRNDRSNPVIVEYKTASRLNDAWIMSFETSHQVSGYMNAASILTGETIRRAMITGLSLPQPVKSGEGVVNTIVRRSEFQLIEWAKWFVDSAERYYAYMDDPFSAPMMTVACNRYFRPCAFIPLCAARDPDEQAELFNLLEVEEWSPMTEKAQD